MNGRVGVEAGKNAKDLSRVGSVVMPLERSQRSYRRCRCRDGVVD